MTSIIILAGLFLGTACFAMREIIRNNNISEDNERLTLDNADLAGQLELAKARVKLYEEINAKLNQRRNSPVILSELKVAKFYTGTDFMVYAKHKDLPMMIIKLFPYDPEDEGDIEFALREAEELIETIQKA